MSFETTNDRILSGQVLLTQPKDGYRAAVDPVFLAAAAEVKNGERALDLGCGVGAAMLCLGTRCPGVHIDGLEVQPHLSQLARANVEANAMADRLRVYEGDLLTPPAALQPDSYAHVFANPPYLSDDRGHPPPNASKKIAHVEGDATLSDWIDAALKFCRTKGSITFIQRADRLADLLTGLSGRAGEITVFPLWPKYEDEAIAHRVVANRVIVRARKGLKTPLQLSAGMVLHNSDGSYTERADAVLRGGALRLRV
ncbi:tRNA1(Val) (adenine(37)-N6)-methyltransferase [Magnetovibrio blakemorei]|uniref:Methyltransferase small domain-containing protein n=1 Tax=Magnetovibrio blakemorei TaxID=28181 RepID=A0A1E5Q5L7_9PROT|nr:methyltransferase [Magnetovibrio blakemorei]OEJ65704.1 hypothetical protein BEN30_13750 [Magnetovibrio blakemorei]